MCRACLWRATARTMFIARPSRRRARAARRRLTRNDFLAARTPSYPDSPFTVVIFHGHSSFYGDANALKGKSIEITGKITRYHDKPEIALDRASQLTVAGSFHFTNAPVLMPTNTPPALPATNFPGIL
jgi:hypothetical protein